MIKNLLVVFLLFVCLIIYTLFIKKDPIQIQEPKQTQKIDSPIIKKEPKLKENIPEIELDYNNLSLEKNYKEEYNQNNTPPLQYPTPPPLDKEEIKPSDDLDIDIMPEVIFDKETKEMSLDKVIIQVEKKF